jgi:GIY-YIG catalytic domain/NUMOD1 domain
MKMKLKVKIMKRENGVKGIIYSAKNKETGEYYVGATTSTMEKRRKDHEEKANNSYGGYFQSSIAGYGKDVFDWVQEDTASSLNELAQKEKDYIIKYDSKSNGYNQNLGGGFQKDIFMYNIYGSHLFTFDSLKSAADWAGTTKKEISRTCLSKHKTISGFMWSYKYVERLYPERDDRCKMVYQFTKDGDLITEFDSVSDASFFTGTNKSSIGKVCRGERHQAGGFLWKYE